MNMDGRRLIGHHRASGRGLFGDLETEVTDAAMPWVLNVEQTELIEDIRPGKCTDIVKLEVDPELPGATGEQFGDLLHFFRPLMLTSTRFPCLVSPCRHSHTTGSGQRSPGPCCGGCAVSLRSAILWRFGSFDREGFWKAGLIVVHLC